HRRIEIDERDRVDRRMRQPLAQREAIAAAQDQHAAWRGLGRHHRRVNQRLVVAVLSADANCRLPFRNSWNPARSRVTTIRRYGVVWVNTTGSAYISSSAQVDSRLPRARARLCAAYGPGPAAGRACAR